MERQVDKQGDVFFTDRLADEQINRWTDRKADRTLIQLIKAQSDVDRQTYK